MLPGSNPNTRRDATPCSLHCRLAKQSPERRQWPLERLEYYFMSHGRKIAVIGLGYVGLPVAAAFARGGSPVIGFDIDVGRIRELAAGEDRTREVEPSDLKLPSLKFTAEAARLRSADFFIITVPTPIDDANRPDLSVMLAASRLVGGALKQGDIVV